MIVIENQFDFGDIVYLKTDKEQLERMVTGYIVRPTGVVIYYLSLGQSETTHYEIEISEEKNVLISSNG